MKSVLINNKWPILLPDHRADRPEWHTPPYWEEKRIESLHKHLTKDDTLFYVGAEEGDIAGLCAMWCKDVFLFEPNDKVWSNIKAIWEANNLKKPFCFEGFASNQTTFEGSIIDEFPESANGPLISDHAFKELQSPGNIAQIRIDDISLKPTAIALDVEGSECEVLKGAEETLKKYHPKIWLSLHPEYMFRIYGQYGAELRDWIIKLGYKETLLDYPLHEVHIFYD